MLPALTAIQGGVRLGLPHPKPEQATIFHQQHLATGLAKDPATTTDFGAAPQKNLQGCSQRLRTSPVDHYFSTDIGTILDHAEEK